MKNEKTIGINIKLVSQQWFKYILIIQKTRNYNFNTTLIKILSIEVFYHIKKSYIFYIYILFTIFCMTVKLYKINKDMYTYVMLRMRDERLR
jgi:hypothetical protein